MLHWAFILLGLIMTTLWAGMFIKQMRSGLTKTALDDRFTWGLYVQGFFYLSGLAGGILVFIAVVTFFEVRAFSRLVEVSAAISFGCLIGGGILLGSDLGKPFRGTNIILGNKFASPLTWDFYLLGICVVLNLVLLLGLIPNSGALSALWSILCLGAALGYMTMHTLFFLSKVGAGFKSQPFLGLDTLAQSLWGGLALISLIALVSGLEPLNFVRLLIVLTIFVLIPHVGTYISSPNSKKEGNIHKIPVFNVSILLVLVICRLLIHRSPALLAVATVMILLSVFMGKYQRIKLYQSSPALPPPYSQFDRIPEYTPTVSEWMLSLGSAGICLFLSSAIIYLKST